jgi:Calcineurin-like phosphoesterase
LIQAGPYKFIPKSGYPENKYLYMDICCQRPFPLNPGCMKKLFAICISLLFLAVVHAQSLNQCEGPYVEYRKNWVVVRSMDTVGKVIIDSFPVAEKEKHPLTIHFSNHTGWDFSVSLQKKLKTAPYAYGKIDRIIAFSDIEGEFEAFRGLLIANKIIDEKYQWIFGKGHLVICGDLFDRGNDVAAELWLLYKLEGQAKDSGGYVHTILGNHDIMNLSGDLRYLQPKYVQRALKMGVEYMDLYSSATELGRWLRSKNIIEKISGNLYLHAGISPEVLALQWPVYKINSECSDYYDLAMQPEKFRNKDVRKFFEDGSPFWYRGYFLEPRASQGLVDSTVNFYQVRKIIVGHDIIDSVSTFYQGKVIGIDVNEHEGNSQGLLIEADSYYKIDLTGNKYLLP